jgi:hypothetical protein
VGQQFPGNVGLIVGNIDYKWTWHQVPFDCLPEAAILDTLGRANSDAIFGNDASTGLPRFPPGSLLLLGVEIKRKNSPFGLRTWTISYTSRYNPRLHNRFYDAVKGRWCECSKDGTYYDPTLPPPDGKLLYDYRPFRKLFVPV